MYPPLVGRTKVALVRGTKIAINTLTFPGSKSKFLTTTTARAPARNFECVYLEQICFISLAFHHMQGSDCEVFIIYFAL